MQIRTVDLSVLNVSVGVYGYNVTTVEYPGAVVAGDANNAPVATRAATAKKA